MNKIKIQKTKIKKLKTNQCKIRSIKSQITCKNLFQSRNSEFAPSYKNGIELEK